MSAKTVSDLQAMGFTELQCTKAVQNVGDNLEAACNWIVTHGQGLVDGAETSMDVAPADAAADKSADAPAAEPTAEAAVVANSFKCGNCGKISATMQMAIVHAERTGHDQIEESEETVVPLTDEQRKEKKAKLLLRIQEKKKENAVVEQREAIESEKRRRTNAQAAADVKRAADEREMKEIVEDRKRAKAAEQKAKQRVLDQINADKEKRRRDRDGASAVVDKPAASKPAVPPPVIDHKNARIQIRQLQTLGRAAPLVHEFSGDEPLAAVRLYIQMHRSDGYTKTDAFHLKTAYPPKTFDDEDMQTPLKTLGLTPSGTLIMEPVVGGGDAGMITIN